MIEHAHVSNAHRVVLCRFSVSSEVSERALREIYLKPFQIALKAGDPWALMTA